MRIYLDVSALNRPLDDQRQPRNRREAEAVVLVLRRIDAGTWAHVSSEMVTGEVRASVQIHRRRRVLAMLPPAAAIMPVTEAVLLRAEQLERLRLRPADAVHVAAAEHLGAAVLLTCDDQLLRVTRRHARRLTVRVTDPVTWMNEHEDEANEATRSNA